MRHDHYGDLGKAAIAEALLRAERADNLTFNFDRSFEYAVFKALRASYRLTGPAAAHLLKSLSITHVHGSLGVPAWIDTDSPDATPYSFFDIEPSKLEEIQLERTKRAARQIRIVHEEIPQSFLEGVWAWLATAKIVCFLGFGFELMNLIKLGTPGSLQDVPVVRGTILGKGKGEQQPILRHFTEDGGQIHLHPMDIVTFLKQTDVLHG
jgi:hypothetical protein